MIGQRDTVNGAHFGFTDRWGGVSAVPYEELNLGGAVGDDPAAVTANRELAAKSLGVDPARVVWMNQVHGADVAVVDGPWGTHRSRGSTRSSPPNADSPSPSSPPTACPSCWPTPSRVSPPRPTRAGPDWSPGWCPPPYGP